MPSAATADTPLSRRSVAAFRSHGRHECESQAVQGAPIIAGRNMFGRGRKSDGFEWHKHVRTTIKLRREDRRARFNDVKEVASDGLKYAGRAGVSASNSGVIVLWNGLISTIQMIIRLAFAGRDAMARTMERAIAPASRSLIGKLDPWLKRLAHSPLMLLLAVAGLVAFHAAFARSRAGGPRSEIILMAVTGTLALITAVVPLLTGHVRWAAPAALRSKAGQVRILILAGLAVAVIAGAYFAVGKTSVKMPNFASFNPFLAKPVEGRATVLSGDIIRISTTTIRLSGIEAPDLNQKCMGANKKPWGCGEAARAAAERIVKGKTVRCDLSGTDEAGRSLGTCLTVNTGTSQNVAEELVRAGAVFAAGGLFSSLTSIESDARAKKLGLWKGEAERPSEYRTSQWDAAAKSAPDGCPIKGLIAGDSKSYLLPWQGEYANAKVRPSKGERWFCSEAEAQAAGWKSALR
jgi:endonuclease YncB( thermonuclease family)